MKANPEAGEVDLVLCGRPFVLRPSFRAIATLEAETGCSMVELTRRLLGMNLSLRDKSLLILHTLVVGEVQPPTLEMVMEQVYKHGLNADDLLESLVRLCSAALSGGMPPKNAAAAEGPKDPTGSPFAA